MNKYLTDYIWRSLLAGIAIGIAAICFLKGGKIVGAVLFSFGLAAVILGKWRLFTGACGFADYRNPTSLVNVFLMLGVNAVGVALTAFAGGNPEAEEAARGLVDARFAMHPAKLFGCAILCGFIMSVAVEHARKGNWIPLLFGIPTFVICGFPHCVADVTYYTLAGNIGFPWAVTILGNFVGCNIPTLTSTERVPLLIRTSSSSAKDESEPAAGEA